MEGSNAMTIDFLRARLLSERAVSRMARQRADELAQRVAELEEQLRVVSIQRKKAENATADVLAILETQGISDASEDHYLSSDNEEMSRSLSKANGHTKSGGISIPEVESSIVFGRSLSWKGCRDSSQSLDKYKEASIRRHNGLMSSAKLSKHHPGKSCRRIRQRDHRSEASEVIDSSQQSNHGNDEVANDETVLSSAGDGSDMLSDSIEFHEVKAQTQEPDSPMLEDERNMPNAAKHECTDCRGETNMEQAVQHQEHLIGQYEAMEKAQREWEEKFQEISSSALETCDPSNHSDVTEETEEKHQVPLAPPAAKSEVGDDSMTKTSPKTQHKLSVSGDEHDHCRHLLGPSSQQVLLKVMDVPHQSGVSHLPIAEGTNQKVDLHARSPLQTPFTCDDSVHSGSPVKQVAGNPHSTFNALVPRGTGTLAGVLSSLKQAKSTLHKQISSVPSLDNRPLGSVVEPCLLEPKPGNRVDIPGGFSGLFRIPSDIPPATHSNCDIPGSSTRSSPACFHPGSVPALPAGNPSVGNHYVRSNLSFPIDDRLVTGQFFDAGPRTTSLDVSITPYLDRITSTRSYSPGTPPYEGAMPTPRPGTLFTYDDSRCG